VNIRIAAFLAVVIFASTAGEISITYGMKNVGEPHRLLPREIFEFLKRALRTGWFWLGIPMMTMSFYATLVLLSWAPVSLVVPATALSYAVGALGAKFILKERVSRMRWAGVGLVCLGVMLAWTG
jgi:drug/metabolite transporter (DMT)-like permease